MNGITADTDIKAELTNDEAHTETMRNLKALAFELVGKIEASVFDRFGAKVGVTLLLVDSSGEDSWEAVAASSNEKPDAKLNSIAAMHGYLQYLERKMAILLAPKPEGDLLQ